MERADYHCGQNQRSTASKPSGMQEQARKLGQYQPVDGQNPKDQGCVDQGVYRGMRFIPPMEVPTAIADEQNLFGAEPFKGKVLAVSASEFEFNGMNFHGGHGQPGEGP